MQENSTFSENEQKTKTNVTFFVKTFDCSVKPFQSKKLSSATTTMTGELALLAYILITVKSGSEREFLKEVSEFKEVVEANLVIGENDVVIKVKVKDVSQLDKFLTDKLRVLPDVFLTTTMIITEQFKTKKA